MGPEETPHHDNPSSGTAEQNADGLRNRRRGRGRRGRGRRGRPRSSAPADSEAGISTGEVSQPVSAPTAEETAREIAREEAEMRERRAIEREFEPESPSTDLDDTEPGAWDETLPEPEAAEEDSEAELAPEEVRPVVAEPVHRAATSPPARERREPRPSQPPVRKDFRPASPMSVQEAIEDVNQIIDTLRNALDEMEEVLETLELAERQKDADEREIESLKRSLRQMQRPREPHHRH